MKLKREHIREALDNTLFGLINKIRNLKFDKNVILSYAYLTIVDSNTILCLNLFKPLLKFLYIYRATFK